MPVKTNSPTPPSTKLRLPNPKSRIDFCTFCRNPRSCWPSGGTAAALAWTNTAGRTARCSLQVGKVCFACTCC